MNHRYALLGLLMFFSITLPLVALILFLHVLTGSVAAKPQMVEVGGLISEDSVWTAVNNPYIITDTVTVEAGATLTVEAGVVVMTMGMGQYLDVQGHLAAMGTAVDPIIFTSEDDLASNSWSGLTVSGSANFAHVTFRHASTPLFIVESSGGDVSLVNSTFEENSEHPIVVATDALHRLKMNNNAFSNNMPNRVGIETGGGNLTLAGSPILGPQPGLEGYEELNSSLPTAFTLPEGYTLTLEAGTNLMMLSTVIIQGHLVASGTMAEPVLWQSVPGGSGSVFSIIVLPMGTAVFNQTTIKGSPTLGIAVVGESDKPVLIENSTMEELGEFPLIIEPPSLHRVQLNQVTFLNNTVNRVLVDTSGGQDAIAADVTLSAQPGLAWYEFADASDPQTPPAEFVVPDGITLTVEPGVELRFGDGAETFVVNGRLITLGTLADPITLTSASNAAAGDWLGLVANGEIDLRNTAVLFGGTNLTVNSSGQAQLENATLSQAEFAGLRVVGGSVTAVRSQFSQNGTDGIVVEDNGTPAVVIAYSAIRGNSGVGLRNLSSAIAEAQSNWWGDESGPSGAGSGSGDGVEGNVNFSAWLTDEVWTMLHYGLYLPSVVTP